MNRSLRQEIAVNVTKEILKMKKQNKTNQNKERKIFSGFIDGPKVIFLKPF